MPVYIRIFGVLMIVCSLITLSLPAGEREKYRDHELLIGDVADVVSSTGGTPVEDIIYVRELPFSWIKQTARRLRTARVLLAWYRAERGLQRKRELLASARRYLENGASTFADVSFLPHPGAITGALKAYFDILDDVHIEVNRAWGEVLIEEAEQEESK